MLRLVGCLTSSHDLRLVLVAAIICVIGAAATFVVSDRAVAGAQRNLWLALLALCATSTVWATHFVAILAYESSVPMTYSPGLTAASYGLGAVVIGLGFGLALRHPGAELWAVIGGAVVGAGVAALHYLGMAAVQLPGHLRHDADLVAASVLLSCGFGAAAMRVSAAGWHTAYGRPLGVLLFIVMVVSLHFTGMGAVRLELGPSEPGDTGLSRQMLVVIVTGSALVVTLIGAASAIVDQRVSRRLAGEAERFRTLADGALEGLVLHHDGVLVDANAAARRLFGLGNIDGTQSIDAWFDEPNPADARRSKLRLNEPCELRLLGADGEPFPAEVCRRHIGLRDGREGEMLAIRDLTSRKRSEARIEHLALHDPLTNLPNRRLFMELANKAINQAERGGARFAVLTIDLDGFKLVNDMYGHATGDELLKLVAERITGTLRQSDTVARFGGDEFVVLQQPATPSQAASLAERLLEVLGAPAGLSRSEVTISASIGVAIFPDDGVDTDSLLRSADTAMYRAKADGKATCRFFEPQMDTALEARRRLELRLRQAIHEGRLDVAYQPLVSGDRQTPLGFEALARWNDSELGVVPPSEFVPVAEESGLISALGELVLRRACDEAVRWSQPLRVAVNLSATQFRRKGLVDMVRRALRDSGLPGQRLELEITESLLIENRETAMKTLTELRAMGVLIAMDDFGTGYSSLSYLQSFPFDKIKIDRSFIATLEREPQSASIVRAVTAMGKSLQMRVVAEGVETLQQARLLQDMQCDELQGYLIARPMPAGEIDAFLQSKSTRFGLGRSNESGAKAIFEAQRVRAGDP